MTVCCTEKNVKQLYSSKIKYCLDSPIGLLGVPVLSLMLRLLFCILEGGMC